MSHLESFLNLMGIGHPIWWFLRNDYTAYVKGVGDGLPGNGTGSGTGFGYVEGAGFLQHSGMGPMQATFPTIAHAVDFKSIRPAPFDYPDDMSDVSDLTYTP